MCKYLPFMLSLCLTLPFGTSCGGGGNNINDPSKPATNPHGNNQNNNNNNNNNNNGSNSVISRIQKNEIAKDTQVKLNDVIITAVETYTKMNQDTGKYEPTGIPGVFVSDMIATAQPYSGIYVNLSKQAEPGSLKIGDVVEIDGQVDEYYGSKQVGKASIQKTGTGTVPAPAVISDVASIATKYEKNEAGGYYTPSATHGSMAKQYAGVLVKVENVKVTNEKVSSLKSNCENPNATPVAETCLANSGFEVGGALVVSNENMYYVPNSLRKNGVEFTSITGVMDYNYSAYVLLPRTADDVVKKGGNNNNEDADSDDDDNATYTQTAINTIQAGSVDADTKVEVSGVVISPVAVKNYKDNSAYSFYLADDNAKAIYAFSVSGNKGLSLDRGKKVTVQGKVGELPSTSGSKYTQWDVKGAGKTPLTVSTTGTEPNPVVLSLANISENSRGQLIKIENVTVSVAADGYCDGSITVNESNKAEYEANGGNYCTATVTDGEDHTLQVKYLSLGSNLVSGDTDPKADSKALIKKWFSTKDDAFDSITGILDVNFGNIVLYPRDDNDIAKSE